MDVNWTFTPKQANLLNDETKYLIVSGSAGSGKTYFAVRKTIMYALNHPNARILVCRQTLPSLKQTSWLEIRTCLYDSNIPHKENKAEGLITFENGSTILFRGLDDEQKIRSLNLDFVYLEQAEETTLEVFNELETRVRGPVSQKYFPQLLLVVTPETTGHWIYKRLYKFRDDPQIKIVPMYYFENSFVSKEYIEMAEKRKKYDYDNWLRLTCGVWQEVGGLIYDNWVIGESNKGYEFYTAGLDFGFSNPACFLLVGWLDGEPYIIDEVYESRLTNNELIMRCNKLLQKYGLNPSSLDAIYADSAEPDRIEEFCNYGYNTLPSIKNVDEKLNSVRGLSKIHINERCKHTRQEIEEYAYLKDKDGNDTEKPQKTRDHAMDALGYCCWGTVGIISPYRDTPEYMEVYTY